MSRDRSSPSRPIRSDSDRPSRHTDHAATMSNSRRGDTLEQGHPAQAALSRPLAPLMPSSGEIATIRAKPPGGLVEAL